MSSPPPQKKIGCSATTLGCASSPMVCREIRRLEGRIGFRTGPLGSPSIGHSEETGRPNLTESKIIEVTQLTC